MICINVNYEDWKPSNVNLGEFYCETGLHKCHHTSTCTPDTKNTSSFNYQCRCNDVEIDGIALKPKWPTISFSYQVKCLYTHPDYNFAVSIFTYNGKPTIYHDVKKSFDMNFKDSVLYCSRLRMHLPIPNTEQQYEDWKMIGGRTGFTRNSIEGTWTNIYNGEKLVIDKWGDNGPKTGGSVSCIKTDLQYDNFCEMNLNNCSPVATCTNINNWPGYTCSCPSSNINGLVLEPALTSTGKGSHGCRYTHPSEKESWLIGLPYAGRNTLIYEGPNAGSSILDYGRKCQSLGMRMLTPHNAEENSIIYHLKENGVRFGITRRSDGQWRNIYTNEKAWTNFKKEPDSQKTDFANAYNKPEAYWNDVNSHVRSHHKTICIAPDDGESFEIDFCGTGFHDCHVGASCTNGGENGYTCRCQPMTFGDISIKPIDDDGTGKNCSYKMPGHDDKTIFPVPIRGTDIVYAFHASSDKHLLRDAIKYCHALDMHLPIPMNDQENADMSRILPGEKLNFFWLGVTDFQKDLKFLNIYTGEKVSFTNWNKRVDAWNKKQPQAGSQYTNVGLKIKNYGKWATYSDDLEAYAAYNQRTICQKGSFDITKFNWCTAGLHNCNDKANCLPVNDEKKQFKCECKKFYVGDGIGENGCTPIQTSTQAPTQSLSQTQLVNDSEVIEYLTSIVQKMGESFEKIPKQWTSITQKFNGRYLELVKKGCAFSTSIQNKVVFEIIEKCEVSLNILKISVNVRKLNNFGLTFKNTLGY